MYWKWKMVGWRIRSVLRSILWHYSFTNCDIFHLTSSHHFFKNRVTPLSGNASSNIRVHININFHITISLLLWQFFNQRIVNCKSKNWPTTTNVTSSKKGKKKIVNHMNATWLDNISMGVFWYIKYDLLLCFHYYIEVFLLWWLWMCWRSWFRKSFVKWFHFCFLTWLTVFPYIIGWVSRKIENLIV